VLGRFYITSLFQVLPGQTESDKDHLLLIQEKEQLKRELRSINQKGRGEEEIHGIVTWSKFKILSYLYQLKAYELRMKSQFKL
jgi:hypothetical protein